MPVKKPNVQYAEDIKPTMSSGGIESNQSAEEIKLVKEIKSTKSPEEIKSKKLSEKIKSKNTKVIILIYLIVLNISDILISVLSA